MENDGENNNVDESSFLNPLEPEEFRRQGHMVIDFIADYYRNIEQYPVRSRVEPGYLGTRIPGSAPNHPEPIEAILRDVGDHILPGLTHWQSPAHFAYFPSSGSTAGFLGEMLSAGFNVVGFNWMSSPAATELEMIVVNWLGQMLDLPNDFLFSGKGSSGGGGVLQGTTCEAILSTLTAARERTLSRIGRDKLDKLVVYASDQSHCAVQKAAKIAGIHPSNFRTIRTTRSAGFALSPEELLSAMESDEAAGLVPAFLCATVGTTSSTAVDPVGALCAAAGDHGAWVHVDAAYAGSACVCPEFRRFIDGVELADSFSLNAHKWLLTTLDCCCLWVKDRNALTRALATSPEYMRNKATDSRRVVDYKDWQIVLSRRFRAMKLWLVLRTYGAANIRGFLRRHVSMAQRFESHVAEDGRFEVVVPRNFATVCFRLLPTPRRPSPPHAAEAKKERQENGGTYEGCGEEEANEMNKRLLESINGSGRLYMTHAVIGGLYVIRFAVGATLTEDRHVSMAWEVVREHASDLLSASPTLDGKLNRGE